MILPLINVFEAEELTLATFQLADLTGEKELQLKSCLRTFNKPPQHLAPQSPVCPHPSWGLALPQPS